jgi:hypothetical protein
MHNCNMAVERKPNVSLYAILARDTRVGVVFRRGPSKQVLLLLWRTDTDQFYEGQWFKGRIYERRCDLSPSGERLIYFAASYKPPYATWTAVSRPPFLTAVALWPKGDAWGGGGLFAKEKEILLNHRPAEMNMAEGFRLPKFVAVKPLGDRSGRGEDDPICDQRLTRDGWKKIQEGKAKEHKLGAPMWVTIDPAEIRAKRHPQNDKPYEIREKLMGVHENNGSWYVIEHVIVNTKSGEEFSLGRTDWADWCHSGDLLYAKEGRLWRLKFDRRDLSPLEYAETLIDLRDRVFVPKESPQEAKLWGGDFQFSAG